MADPSSSPKDSGLFSDRPSPSTGSTAADPGRFSERPLRSREESAPSKAKSPARWIVPLVMFAVIVGGLAWLVQNMPAWRSKTVEAPALKGPEALLRFVHPHLSGVYMALWEKMPEEKTPADKAFYAREFEREAKGRYYFPFAIHEEYAAEIGVGFKSCDCSRLHVAMVPKEEWEQLYAAIRQDPAQEVQENPAWEWKPLEKTEKHGVALPAGCRGVIRIIWDNRRAPGESLNLGARVWARASSAAGKQEYGLRIDAVSSHPLRTKNDRIDVGILEAGGKGKAEFLVWSPTRDDAKFTFPQKDELFEIGVKNFTPAECAALQTKLRTQEINTRVRAAWTISVTVHEQKGKHQFDQGHFSRAVTIDSPDAVEDLPPLVVTGIVKSELQIGGVDNQGKINLKSFDAKLGTKTNVVLLPLNQNIELDLANVQHPPGLTVELTETAKRKWNLKVDVPPHRFFGAIAEDTVVVLRTKAGRSIRIPFMGNAFQR